MSDDPIIAVMEGKYPEDQPGPAVESKPFPAYFLFRDISAVFWTADNFFRVDGAPVLKPLSPCLTTEWNPGSPVGAARTPTMEATYQSLCAEGCGTLPEYIAGHFERIDEEKVAFCFNPNNALRLAVRAVLFSAAFPDVPIGPPISVALSIKPPSRRVPIPFPFVLDVSSEGGAVFREPSTLIPPVEFMEELVKSPTFNVCVGI